MLFGGASFLERDNNVSATPLACFGVRPWSTRGKGVVVLEKRNVCHHQIVVDDRNEVGTLDVAPGVVSCRVGCVVDVFIT